MDVPIIFFVIQVRSKSKSCSLCLFLSPLMNPLTVVNTGLLIFDRYQARICLSFNLRLEMSADRQTRWDASSSSYQYTRSTRTLPQRSLVYPLIGGFKKEKILDDFNMKGGFETTTNTKVSGVWITNKSYPIFSKQGVSSIQSQAWIYHTPSSFSSHHSNLVLFLS